jgi:hypothetical protein
VPAGLAGDSSANNTFSSDTDGTKPAYGIQRQDQVFDSTVLISYALTHLDLVTVMFLPSGA